MTRPTEHGRSAGRDDLSRQPPMWVSRTAARRVVAALHVVAAAVVALELVVPFGTRDAADEAAHGVERVATLEFVASYSVFGFFACVALVLLGRLLRVAVMRDERYYEEDE